MKKECKHEKTVIIEKEETYPVKGESITVTANVRVCVDCGQEIFDYDLDNENIKRAFREYKRCHSLLKSEEIKALREKYGISQRTLAKLIGSSQATLVRYERGDIQDNTHNRLLKMLFRLENMAELAEGCTELSEKEYAQIQASIKEMQAAKREDNSVDLEESFGHGLVPDAFTGFRAPEWDKIAAMVRFFAEHNKQLYKTKLMKLLWYADMAYFRENVVSISGLSYLHRPFGPVPKNHTLLLGRLEEQGYIQIEEVLNEYGTAELIQCGKEPLDYNKLSEEELEILQRVNDRFNFVSAREISMLSHKESGYSETQELEPISYKYALELAAI